MKLQWDNYMVELIRNEFQKRHIAQRGPSAVALDEESIAGIVLRDLQQAASPFLDLMRQYIQTEYWAGSDSACFMFWSEDKRWWVSFVFWVCPSEITGQLQLMRTDIMPRGKDRLPNATTMVVPSLDAKPGSRGLDMLHNMSLSVTRLMAEWE